MNILKDSFLKFIKIRYLSIGKGRRIMKIPRPFFLTNTASAFTEAVLSIYLTLFGSIYLPYGANSI